MGRRSLLVCATAAVVLFDTAWGTRAASQASATIFEGARLIIGDGSPPIERAALVVQDGTIVAAGPQGEVAAPAGSTRVNLAGKTVIPALVNLHGHVGFQRGWSYVAANYTRDNIVDHLNRYAYYGVGTVASLGTDAGEIPRGIQRDQRAGILGGAWLRHAGRGFALPNAGPGLAAMRAAPYGVTSADDARAGSRCASARRSGNAALARQRLGTITLTRDRSSPPRWTRCVALRKSSALAV